MTQTFGVRSLPSTFFFKDGQVYEFLSLEVGYQPVRKFLEGGYLDDTKYYQKFDTPRGWEIYNKVTIQFRYVYNTAFKYLIEKRHYKKIFYEL